MYTKKELDAYLAAERRKTKESGSTGHSTGKAAEVTAAVLNTPDAEFAAYKPDDKGGMTAVRTTPVRDFRDTTAAVVGKALGLDKAEQGRLADSMEFSVGYGRAFNAAADMAEAAYLSTGRAKAKPQIGADVSRITIRLEKVPADAKPTSKIVKKADGTYESVPTGMIVETAEHRVLKAKNTTRPWHRKQHPAK